MKKFKHILIIPSWYPTPENPISGIFFKEQAHALYNYGYQVGVITPEQLSLKLLAKKTFDPLGKIELENDQGIPTYRRYSWGWFPRIPYGNSYLWIKSGKKLFTEYLKIQGMPDIIHAHSALLAGVLAAEIKKSYGIPYVITEHSSAYARNLLSYWQLNLARQAFQEATRRIVVSPCLGELLTECLGQIISPYLWIPNTLDYLFINLTNNKIKAQCSPFRFLNVALMTANKGQEDLIKAFAQQFKGNEQVQLRLGGDGESRPFLQKLTEQLQINSQVIFLGQLNREQVLEEMQKTNAFVLSSHYETFGIVLIEALACGKPVIATACGGPECIVNSNNGLLVAPRKPTKLAQAMEEIYKNIHNYNSEQIRQDCLKRFSPETVIRQLSEIYQNIENR